MDELHKKILRENRGYIVNNLADIESVVDGLYIQEVLTEGMKQDILEGENTAIKRARKLLDIIPKRGPFAFDMFCNVLVEKNHKHIAQTLNPALKSSETIPLPPRPTSSGSSSSSSATSFPVPTAVIMPGSSLHPTKPRHEKMPVQSSSTPPQPSSMPSSIPSSGSLPDPSIGANSMKKPENKPTELPTNYGRQSSTALGESDYIFTRAFISLQEPLQETVAFYNWPAGLDFSLGSKDFVMKRVDNTDLKLQLGLDKYPVTQVKRGRAVVISNRTFDEETFAERKSSENDSFRIQVVLKDLGFRCIVKYNLTKEGLFQELKKEKENDQLDMFVLVIMSYGGSGTVLSTDGVEIPVKEIIDVLSAKNCPSLIGKPKLFFIQACGTQLKDIPIKPQSSDKADEATVEEIGRCMEKLNLGNPYADFVDTKQGPPPPSNDPLPLDETSDMLVAMATSPDQNHEKYSSLFILGLSYVLSNYAKSHHIQELIQKVNELKWDSSLSQYVTLCDCRHSLSKLLYFLPGYAPEEADIREEDFHSIEKSPGKQ